MLPKEITGGTHHATGRLKPDVHATIYEFSPSLTSLIGWKFFAETDATKCYIRFFGGRALPLKFLHDEKMHSHCPGDCGCRVRDLQEMARVETESRLRCGCNTAHHGGGRNPQYIFRGFG